MKRILGLGCAIVMLQTLAGCQGTGKEPDDTGQSLLTAESSADIRLTGGVPKHSAKEVVRLKNEADGLFREPPAVGTETTVQELNAMIEEMIAPRSGNTSYERYLSVMYKHKDGRWKPDFLRKVVRAWLRDDQFSAWEFLYLDYASEPDRVGDAECVVRLGSESDKGFIKWVRSQTVSSDFTVSMSGETTDGTFGEFPDAVYKLFPDETVNGHTCKVIGMEEGEAEATYIWFATDLKRPLIIMTILGNDMFYTYVFEKEYLNADDSYFVLPQNVDFK